MIKGTFDRWASGKGEISGALLASKWSEAAGDQRLEFSNVDNKLETNTTFDLKGA